MIEKQRSQLEIRCHLVQKLFYQLLVTDGRCEKEMMVEAFRQKYPKLEKDLNFCFEVLAGKHKLGYTFICTPAESEYPEFKSIRKLVERLKQFSSSEYGIIAASQEVEHNCQPFIQDLVNRVFKLGYSNKNAMITDLSPMLAKKYPDDVIPQKYYYVQEKLDGNRCLAYYAKDCEQWLFRSRSGKQMNLSFDMSWAHQNLICDGEVMTLSKAGTCDFNKTSGAINSKYGDKSGLHYFIYDIADVTRTYEERKSILDDYRYTGPHCSIVPVLDKVWVYPDAEDNHRLDAWLDQIVDAGGEGIMLRDQDAVYEQKRSSALLKYKKLQTCDLRIIGWNAGKGKYEGAIGSFQCTSDCGTIEVNVAGMTDDIRFSEPEQYIGKIIEVAYFDSSKSKNKNTESLRFPRIKSFREDKEETSLF